MIAPTQLVEMVKLGLERLLDFSHAIWIRFRGVLVVLILFVCLSAFVISFVQLLNAIAGPPQHCTWHYLRFEATLAATGQPATEEKWVCQ